VQAIIDIKTPAGQSLEGFPLEVEHGVYCDILATGQFIACNINGIQFKEVTIHPGDTITIKIV